jgi:hypothetical protein
MKGSKAACKVFTFDNKNGHIGTDKIILNWRYSLSTVIRLWD